MNQIQKYIFTVLILLSGLTGCSKDEVEPLASGSDSIGLSGVLTRSGEAAPKYSNLFLTAFPVGDNGSVESDKYYIDNLGIDAVELSTTENKPLVFGSNTITYPLENKKIAFFAHTGKREADNVINIVSGSDSSNDYLISNGEDDNTGTGTHGSSGDKATLLTFRHLMTKVDVEIIIDDTDFGSVSNIPTPADVKIEMNKDLVATKGTFGLLSNSVTAQGTDSYTLKNGTNYLVPTGKTLSGEGIKAITSLVIHDYKASDDDLKALVIPETDLGNDFVLNPGEAYKLTFTVKRLQVTSIAVKKSDWSVVEIGNENSSYLAKILEVTPGSYAGDSLINKVVLHTTDGKQYIGDCLDNKAKFAMLPASGVTSVDFYTGKGLLVKGIENPTYTYNAATNSELSVELSASGMKIDNGVYLAENAQQLLNIKKDGVPSKYRQESYIDFAGYALQPLSDDFQGEYNGNGKRLLNMKLAGNGLFASNSGKLENIRIVSGMFTAVSGYAGSICGTNASTGTIEGCINEADLKGVATHAGGICGKNEGTVKGCLNTGDLFTGSEYSAGICGESFGTIVGCVNVGMMNRKSTAMAGICGGTNTSAITTCYWLTGTAKKYSGNTEGNTAGDNPEYGDYGSPTVNDVADLSPVLMRDISTSNLLKTASGWTFIYDPAKNGCAWPMPTKTNP